MKFSLFAHMERVDSDTPAIDLYEEFVELCKVADEGGMRAIWTGEHHGMDFTIAPNPFITIADLAHHTSNVRLGTGTVVAPFWHPIRLAGEAAMTDLMTKGRLEVGLARGAYTFEYERLMPGMDAWEAGGRLREIVPAVQKLWAGNYAHEGEFFQFPKTTSAPRPAQTPGPPMWIAARDPNSHEFAVANHCNVQVTPLWNGVDEVETLIQRFNDACEKHKPNPRPQVMLLQHTYVAADDDELNRATRNLSRFYNYFGAWFKNERNIDNAQIEPLTEKELAANAMMTPDVMRKNLCVGSAQEVIDRLRHYEDLGYDEFSYWIDSGMNGDDKKRSLRRFIDDVMPAFT